MPPTAVTLALGPTPASVLLLTLRMMTATPMPTNPPATAPATPLTVSLSPARTWTPPSAVTPPKISADVPAGGELLRASLATLPVGALEPIEVVAPPMSPASRLLVEYSPSSTNHSKVLVDGLSTTHSAVFVAGSVLTLTTSFLAR